jgi:hypothetical protein
VRRRAVVRRAQNPWGVANQGFRMAMNAAEHPVAELNLADRSDAMSELWRKSQSVPLRVAARQWRLAALRKSRELERAIRAQQAERVPQVARLLAPWWPPEAQRRVAPRVQGQRARKPVPQVLQLPPQDSRELQNLAQRARRLSRRASLPRWSWPPSRLPLLLRRRPNRGNACAHVRRAQDRWNSSASSFR